MGRAVRRAPWLALFFLQAAGACLGATVLPPDPEMERIWKVEPVAGGRDRLVREWSLPSAALGANAFFFVPPLEDGRCLLGGECRVSAFAQTSRISFGRGARKSVGNLSAFPASAAWGVMGISELRLLVRATYLQEVGTDSFHMSENGVPINEDVDEGLCLTSACLSLKTQWISGPGDRLSSSVALFVDYPLDTSNSAGVGSPGGWGILSGSLHEKHVSLHSFAGLGVFGRSRTFSTRQETHTIGRLSCLCSAYPAKEFALFLGADLQSAAFRHLDGTLSVSWSVLGGFRLSVHRYFLSFDVHIGGGKEESPGDLNRGAAVAFGLLLS
jgi:hypothetical protein